MHPRHFLFLILLCASSGLCFGQSGGQVLQSTLQKMGGAERWQALRSLEVSYRQDSQAALSLLDYDSTNNNKTSTDLKYYSYLDFYTFISKNIDNETPSYLLRTQDSTFVYVNNMRGTKKNQLIGRKNDAKIDTILFHIQNVEFLPRLILDCLQGKVAYEYEGLKKVEGKDYHSFWLSYQGYAKPLHLLIGKDYLPYQYNRYESKQGELAKSVTFVEYHLFEQMLFPKLLQQNTYQKQEVMGFQTQNNAITVLKLQSVKVNEAPSAEVLKILKR